MLTRAASSARLRPEDTPTPSIAVPLLHMIAFTSAKSTFTRPGMVMMSLMPWTPCSAVLHRCLVWGTQQVTAATLRHECSDVTHLHPPDFRGGLPFPHIDHAPGCQQKSLSLARQEPALWGTQMHVQPHLAQHVVGQQEGVLQRRVVAHHIQQPAGGAEPAGCQPAVELSRTQQ